MFVVYNLYIFIVFIALSLTFSIPLNPRRETAYVEEGPAFLQRTCCTIVKGRGNGGCLLHYAHVLYDFVIPFDWEYHHGDGSIRRCEQLYIPKFPLLEIWMRTLYPNLPIISYGARGSCHGNHSRLHKKIINLSSVDIIRTIVPPDILKEFRDHVLNLFPSIKCANSAFTKSISTRVNKPASEIVVVSRANYTTIQSNFTTLCRHYNRGLKRWLGPNMPISCNCDSGASRGNLRFPEAIVRSFEREFPTGPDGSTAMKVVLRNLEGLSVQDTVNAFCRAAIIIGHHGAGLLNTLFAPPGAILLEVPREKTGGHRTMMSSHCEATSKIHIRLDDPLDFEYMNESVEIDFKNPKLNMTHIIRNRLAKFEWYSELFQK